MSTPGAQRNVYFLPHFEKCAYWKNPVCVVQIVVALLFLTALCERIKSMFGLALY